MGNKKPVKSTVVVALFAVTVTILIIGGVKGWEQQQAKEKQELKQQLKVMHDLYIEAKYRGNK